MNIRHLPAVTGLAAAVALGGCQTVYSNRVPPSAANDPAQAGDGILYYLPRQLTLVTVKRADVDLNAAIESVENAAIALDAAKAAETAAKAAVEATRNQIIAGGHSADALKLLNDRLKANEAAVTASTTSKTEKEAALATARQRLKDLGVIRQGQKQAERMQAERVIAASRQTAADDRVSATSRQLAIKVAALAAAQPPMNAAQQSTLQLENKIKALKEELQTADLARRQEIRRILPGLEAEFRTTAARVTQQSAQIETLAKEIATLETNLSDQKKALVLAEQAFENTLLLERLSTTWAPDQPNIKYDLTLNLSVEEPSPDTSFAFRLSPEHNWLRDDSHKITVSKKGLLTSTDIVATDRTADIIVELGRLAGAIAGFAPPGAFAELAEQRSKQAPSCVGIPDEYAQRIDIADHTDLEGANQRFACYGVHLKNRDDAGIRAEQDKQPIPQRPGIFYRAAGEIIVDIERCEMKNDTCASPWVPYRSVALTLPQAGRIGYISQPAGITTKTQYAAKFSDGMLVDYSSDRPSEILQIAGTPIRVIGAVFDGISKVISLRTGQNNALAGLSESQLAVLNAQAKYEQGQINNQKTLTDAERTLLEARVALQAAEINGDTALTEAQITQLNKQVALQALGISSAGQLTQAQIDVLARQIELDALRQKGESQASAATAAASNAQVAAMLQANANQVALSNSELATAIAILRNTSRTRSLRKCIESTGVDNIETCLPN
jgi:hypothetical protein